MNSAPALDDYLLDLLGDVGAAAAPARPAPVAVASAPIVSTELDADADEVEVDFAGVADPATIAAIMEELEKDLAPPQKTDTSALSSPPAADASADANTIVPDNKASIASVESGAGSESKRSTAIGADTAAGVADPATIAAIMEELEKDLASQPKTSAPAASRPPAASVAAPAPLPASAPRPLPSGSPAMTLISPVAVPKTALPPLPDKPFLQAPIDSGARRRAAERTTRWLRMRCDTQHYALELLKVQEVVLPGTLLPLRGAAAHMLGVMNLRGQVVPVIDLGLYLGRRQVESDASTRVVVLEEQGEILGLRVSAVEDVTNLTDQQIEPPDNARVGRITNHLFRGVARLNERAVILLDASQLLK